MKMQDGGKYVNDFGKEVIVSLIPKDYRIYPKFTQFGWIMPVFKGDDGNRYYKH